MSRAVAPSAVCTPNSRERWDTKYAMTPYHAERGDAESEQAERAEDDGRQSNRRQQQANRFGDCAFVEDRDIGIDVAECLPERFEHCGWWTGASDDDVHPGGIVLRSGHVVRGSGCSRQAGRSVRHDADHFDGVAL